MDYSFYGALSGVFFSIFAWFYLYDPEFRQLWMMYIGSGFFMFIIMLYMLKLARQDNKNSRLITIAGHFAVIVGIIVSVGICYFLCFIYKPEVFSTSAISGGKPGDSLLHVFVPAILVNFFAGSFVCLLSGLLIKRNLQAKENPASL